MSIDAYAVWRAELKDPTPPERRADRTTDPKLLSGFWRINAARTKHDHGVAIWTAEGEDFTIFQIGRKKMDTATNSDEWASFVNQTFLGCTAVSKADWSQALDTGFWPDGKAARAMDEAEKMGIDTSAGDNDAPVEESIADQIAAAVAKAKATPEPKTQAEADAATGIVDKLRALWKIAEAKRVEEKTPHDNAAKAVQAKWLPIMAPAETEGAALDTRRKAYLRKEQARLDAIAAEEKKKRDAEVAAERERVRLETAERLRKEAEAAAKESEAQGGAPISQDDIDAEALRMATEAVPEAAPVESQRATAGSTFGRKSGLKLTKVATVEDVRMLTEHFIHSADTEFLAYLQQRAATALRGKVVLPGVKVTEELR